MMVREQTYLELQKKYQPEDLKDKKLRQIREAFDILGKDEEAPEVDHYKVLGVPKNASMKQIRDEYHLQGRIYYPDFFNNGFNDDKFEHIKKSYEALCDMHDQNLTETQSEDEAMLTEILRDGDQAQKTTWTNDGKFTKINVSNWTETKEDYIPVKTEQRTDGEQAQKTTWSSNGKLTKMVISNWHEAQEDDH